ncbi:MAG: carbamoyltransferase HypF [Candidatus Binatus sp.]|uniref:carbamoyltransferase HypF n=1 Tax=Candidatus Binatus sp. TaxID=2811406 RepID=UPI003D108010
MDAPHPSCNLAPPGDRTEGRRIRIGGTVQGVGFRPWVHRLAGRERVRGRVWNSSTGATIEAFGTAQMLDRFVRLLSASAPPAARIEGIVCETIPPEHLERFEIVQSRRGAERRLAIPPDIAICADCLSEIFDPADRRYRYPFTNCTNCGPRFTITRDIPYDRPATTMARFAMCPECRCEYQAVADRRFHAEPNACPRCGPALSIFDPSADQTAAEPDAIRAAARAIAAGRIVAIKGIGGFHLACDATSSAAVRRLRSRKRREQKPLAVMVRDLAEAQRLADLTQAETAVLVSSERPIVLVRRRDDAELAGEIAPDNPMLGLMLPYSPLHHLIVAEAGRPLVMTSGNLSEEPIAYRNDEAIARLGAVADLFVLHDREIVTRCDDSVVRVLAGAPTVIRRSRGYVPRAIALPRAFSRPVLACGAQLKNTFCIGVGARAYLGPHIGDLENLDTFQSFEESIARMERFLEVNPEVIAHDLHPDYLSTLYARSRSGLVAVQVQHHHAHVASAMAEHGLTGPVLGLAFDGTGYGSDGHAWGGEFLLADFAGFTRLATFRPLALAGGDTAIRKVWRIALAMLDDAFAAAAPLDDLALFAEIAPRDLTVVRRMIATRFNAPLAHGLGRYFDAFGALVLGLTQANYEGQVAMRLEWAADSAERAHYRFDVDRNSSPWEIDLRQAVRDAVRDLLRGVGAGVIAARFHNTLVCAAAEVVRAASASVGRVPIVLTGGCFQNARLAEGIASALARNFDVYTHRSVPPGDGGIALGQAMVADARTRAGGSICA